MKSVPAKKPARRTHAGGTISVSRYAIQIRDGFVDTPSWLRSCYRQTISCSPSNEKAAGDPASGQIRVRKRMRVEMSPAPVGPPSNAKSWISLLRTKHRNLIQNAEIFPRQPAVGAVAVMRPVCVAPIECRRLLAVIGPMIEIDDRPFRAAIGVPSRADEGRHTNLRRNHRIGLSAGARQ